MRWRKGCAEDAARFQKVGLTPLAGEICSANLRRCLAITVDLRQVRALRRSSSTPLSTAARGRGERSRRLRGGGYSGQGDAAGGRGPGTSVREETGDMRTRHAWLIGLLTACMALAPAVVRAQDEVPPPADPLF